MMSVVTCEFSDTNTHQLMFGTQPCTIVLGSVRNLGTKQFSPLTAADLEKDPVTIDEAREAVIMQISSEGNIPQPFTK